MRFLFLVILFVCTTTLGGHAQVLRGEIENTSIDFIKSKQIVLPQYDKETTTAYQGLKTDSLQTTALRLDGTIFKTNKKVDLKPKLSLLEDKGAAVPTKQNYVKAGIGNYLTLNLEGLYGTTLSDATITGQLRHISSTLGADRYGSLGRTELDLIYNKAINPHAYLTLTPRISLHRYNFYGRESALIDGKNSVRQNIYRGGVSLTLAGKSKKLPYSLLIDVSRASTSATAGENVLRAEGTISDFKLANNLNLVLTDRFSFSNLGQEKSAIRLFNVLEPSVAYRKDALQVAGTLGVGLENDTIDNASIHILPYLRGRYVIDSVFYVSAGVGSTMRQTYLNDLLYQNPWLGQNNSLAYQRSQFVVEGEVGGSFGSVDVSLKPSFQAIKHYTIFSQEQAGMDTSQFAASQIAKSLNLFAVTLQGAYHLSDRVRLGSSLTYQSIDNVDGIKIPYFSNVLFKTSLAIRASDKLTLTPSVIINSEQTGYTSRGQAVKLGVVHDVQVMSQYAVSDRISGILELYNLFNNRAYIYTNYRYRGVMGLVGLRLNF